MTAGPPSLYERGVPLAGSADVSDRSRGIALVLAVLGGVFGLHRFYTDRVQSGIWMCLTLGGAGIWYLYDVIVVAAGDFRDAAGRRVSRWGVAETASPGSPTHRRLEDVEDRLQALQSQVTELAERLDFAERLLAQQKERGSLPKG